MSLTKLSSTLVANSAITSEKIANNAITTEKISNNVTLGGPKIANVQYADASFTVLDDTAANTAGTARLIINGEGFNSGAIVIVGTTQASSTTLVNSAQLRANVTAQAAGSYPIYVQNSDGGTAIRVGGVTFSNTPIWGTAATLSNQAANTAFAVSVSANSDSNVTYSNTTSLPAGTSLLSNGYFYGTVTIGSETTYTFDVKANDAENQDVSRTFSLTVTVTPQYQLWSWGGNNYALLGLNDTSNRSSPVQLGSSTDWNSVNSNAYHTIFVKNNGTLWVSGTNWYGQLGLNQVNNYISSPVQIGSSTNWKLDSIFGYSTGHSAAIKTDGTLWAWGRNAYGGLGLGDITNRSSPVQVGSSTNWSLVHLDHYGILAVKTDNTLWSWGRNELYGNLGVNDLVSRSSPVQIGTNTDWSLVRIGIYVTLAVKTNGTLWTWGFNGQGTLGLGDRISRSSPVQIGSSTNWSKVSTRAWRSGAIKTDGTLWTWGLNYQGQLGLDDTTHRSSPVQVGSNTNWQTIEISRFTAATKTDGSLWLWGHNSKGSIGQNDSDHRSSPVQLGTGTNWSLTSIGGYNITARRQV